MANEFKLVPTAASYGSSALARDFEMHIIVHERLVIDSATWAGIVFRSRPGLQAGSHQQSSHSKLHGLRACVSIVKERKPPRRLVMYSLLHLTASSLVQAPEAS